MNATQKQERIARAKRHVEADRLISGEYVVDGHRGCSVGCDAIDIAEEHGLCVDNSSDYHRVVSDHDGTPEWLEHLRDIIYEGLPEERQRWWHVALAEALPVTDDWQPIYHQVCIAMLEECLADKKYWRDPYKAQVIDAIERTIEYHRFPVTLKRYAAESAAESAARIAGEAAVLASTISVEAAARSARHAALAAKHASRTTSRAAGYAARYAAGADVLASAEAAAHERIAASVIDILDSS